MAPGGFRRVDRLRRSAEFEFVQRMGRRAAGQAFVVLAARPRAERAAPRLGITVSRKVGNAVVRNRVKRRVREWFRRDGRTAAAGFEIVVIGRAAAAALPAANAERELCDLVRKATGARGAV
jgi:ribonuclease P protein component